MLEKPLLRKRSFAGRTPMDVGLARCQKTVHQAKKKLVYFAMTNARKEWLVLVLIVIQFARKAWMTRDFSVAVQNMDVEPATPGNLVIL